MKYLFSLTLILVLAISSPVHAYEELTICEIQEVPVGRDSSFYAGDTVITAGIVTAGTGLYYAGSGVTFYMQDTTCGEFFSGIMAYNPESAGFPDLYPGDSIRVTAEVREYAWSDLFCVMTELDIIPNGFEFISWNNPEPIPLVTTAAVLDSAGGADSLAERYEGVLTRVYDVTIDTILEYGSIVYWVCSDTTGHQVYVREASDSIPDDFRPPMGTQFEYVTGVIYNRFGLYNLQPRYMRDMKFPSGAPIIAGTRHYPPYVIPEDTVHFSCRVIDFDGIVVQVKLWYREDVGGWQDIVMTTPGDSTYHASIGPHPDGARIDYYIEAVDDEFNVRYDPSDAPVSFYTYTVKEPTPMTIAEAREDLDQNYLPDHRFEPVIVSGVVTASQFGGDDATDIYIQDHTGGINVFYEDTMIAGLDMGDSVEVSGIVDQYNGKCEMIVYFQERIQEVGQGTIPEPLVLTCGGLGQFVGEENEGKLVKIQNVFLIPDPDPWPGPNNAANMTIHDLADSATLRIDEDTDIGFHPEPPSPMHIVGILSQYDYIEPYDDHYQLTPRMFDDFDTVIVRVDDKEVLSWRYELHPNYPNPFNPKTVIGYDLARPCEVTLGVYNLAGQKVRTLLEEEEQPGRHRVIWDGRSDSGQEVASGVYFYRIQAGDFTEAKRMVLLR